MVKLWSNFGRKIGYLTIKFKKYGKNCFCFVRFLTCCTVRYCTVQVQSSTLVFSGFEWFILTYSVVFKFFRKIFIFGFETGIWKNKFTWICCKCYRNLRMGVFLLKILLFCIKIVIKNWYLGTKTLETQPKSALKSLKNNW